MKNKYIISAAAATLVLAFGAFASAQAVSAPTGAVNVTTMPSTAGVTPGSTGTTFGTISVSGNGGGTYSIASIPVTVTPGNGASASNLSNCQIYNSNGSALNTSGNVVNSLSSGSNTFAFDTPLQVSSATTTLSVRCDVSNSASSGGTYQFVAGTPMFASGMNVMVTTPASVDAGANDAVLALITLDGTRSGQNSNVASVPVTLTFNGASASEFSNCSLENVNNLGVALNTGANAVGSLTNGTVTTIGLDTPVSVPSGSAVILALTCNVASVTPVGSSVMVSVDPATISTTNASTGTTLTPGTDYLANGSAAPVMGTVEVLGPGATTGTGTVTPGAPNTGAGGNLPLNLAILAISGAVLLFGTRALLMKRS